MSYTIAGRVIKNEYLVLGTLAAVIGGTVGFSGGEKKAPANAPVPVAQDSTIKADSKDELDFIRQFVADAEKAEKSGGH
ncbi:hypothetical protein DB88DRAFT_499966 [Papiliotrema laurentii]|uniref:Uncharacterized protein n=1 Tax=Papiliotrema laurentii TaxID=5418 RepID=A0AAD9CS67_PAPLA|nr:hypothetical protein DB88DRAFT_499966 [Papiliotrema laurentii]